MNKELTPLEAWKKVELYCENNASYEPLLDYLEIIETALKEYEGAKAHIEALNIERVANAPKLTAFEIIKKKRVLIDVLLDVDTLKDYNDFKTKEEQLLQEEYDLLKKELKYVKDFINQIEVAKMYCAENNMILVKILIPRKLSEKITKKYKTLYAKTTSLQIYAYEGIPVCIRDDITKPQFVFEVA